MSRVRLGDIVSRVKDFEDKDNTDLLYYVGGEHFDNRSLTVNRKGVIKGSTIGPAFHTKFTSGDVLLMSRNPHLRKAGMVDFDGICSDVSYIIRTNDEKIIKQKFIALLFQSDIFWNFAERNKKGSTNFFLNWSDFEKFEFDLSDIDEQEKLCEVLWAIDDTIKSYQEQIKQCDELVKGQFVEMFGELLHANKHKTVKLGDICSTISGGTPSTKHLEYYGGNIPWVTTVQLGPNYISKEDAKTFITQEGINNSATHLIEENSILFGTRVGVGKSSINVDKMCTNQDINAIVNIDNSKWEILYIKYVLDQYQPYFNNIKKGATILGITIEDLKNIEIPDVNKIMQKEFTSFVRHLDKSKFAIKEVMKNAQKIFDGILRENLK